MITEKSQEIKRTRCQVAIDIMKLIATTYPSRWTANDISIQILVNKRTVNRILTDMVKSRLCDLKYNSYTISLEVINQFYGAKFAVEQEVKKITMIQSKKQKGKPNDKK